MAPSARAFHALAQQTMPDRSIQDSLSGLLELHSHRSWPCSCEWTRRKTDKSQDDASQWLYLPTIYPADSLIDLRLTSPLT